MRTGADLTPFLGPLEADHGRKLGPVDRIEEAVLALDRHARQSCRAAAAAWLRVRALLEVALEGVPANPEALGDGRDRDGAQVQQGTTGLDAGRCELLRLAPFASPRRMHLKSVPQASR